jgi:hypothetical protein
LRDNGAIGHLPRVAVQNIKGENKKMANEFDDIFVVPLSDGRLQYFAIDTNFQLWSQWKETTDPNSPWTELTPFEMPPTKGVIKICGAQLPNKQVQLFVIDVDRNTWSSWSGDSGWTPWTTF